MDTDFEELAELAVDLDAVVSDGSAGQLWRSSGMRMTTEPEFPTLTIARDRSRVSRPGVILHRRDLGPRDQRQRSGIPVTTPTRTAVDLARYLPMADGVVTADSVLNSKLATAGQLAAAAAAARGPNSANARLAIAKADGRSQSVPESLMRLFFHGCPEVGRVVPQWRFDWDGHPYDLGLPELRTVVEYQSWEWHNNRQVWRRDAHWGNLAQAMGWRYIQVMHEDLLLGALHLASLVLGF